MIWLRQHKMFAAIVVSSAAFFQIVSWAVWGRGDLDDAVLRESVNGLVGHLRSRGQAGDRPRYLFVCPALLDQLSNRTTSRVRSRLSSQGITLITSKDLTPQGALPASHSVASSLCITELWQAPFVGVVDVADGYGEGAIGYDYREKELRIFVLGRWFGVRRFDGGSIL